MASKFERDAGEDAADWSRFQDECARFSIVSYEIRALRDFEKDSVKRTGTKLARLNFVSFLENPFSVVRFVGDEWLASTCFET